METAATNIITAMENNIFNVIRVDSKIREEVPFFKKILLENFYNNEVFHGYINKIYNAWETILKDSFKNLILVYNKKYDNERLLELKRQRIMIEMANEYDSQRLFSSLDDLYISDNISTLTKSFKSSGISKKPIRKRKN